MTSEAKAIQAAAVRLGVHVCDDNQTGAAISDAAPGRVLILMGLGWVEVDASKMANEAKNAKDVDGWFAAMNACELDAGIDLTE